MAVSGALTNGVPLTKRWFPSEHNRLLVLGILVSVLLVGLVLRLDNLTTKTIGQVETYVPGIHYPSGGVSDLETRLTIKDTIKGVIIHDQDPNPIGYYLLMLAWTRVFGASVLAIRLPSVIFGVGAIVLTYYLGSLEKSTWIGLLGAAMVALNGYLIFWSQIAKMYIVGCFLGLLASILLLLAYRNSERQRQYGLLYMTASLAGLVTVVFFWLLFATHVVWTLGRALSDRTRPPTIIRFQILTLILGNPLLALAVFQARRPSYLDHNPIPSLVEYLQFGFLFVPDEFAIPPRAIPMSLGFITLALAVLLSVFGLSESNRVSRQRPIVDAALPWFVSAIAAIGSCLVTLRFAKLTYVVDPNRTKLVIALAAVVLVVPFLDLLISKSWHHFNGRWGDAFDKWNSTSSNPIALSALLAFLPIAMLTVSTPAVSLLAPRTALPFFALPSHYGCDRFPGAHKEESRLGSSVPALGVDVFL